VELAEGLGERGKYLQKKNGVGLPKKEKGRKSRQEKKKKGSKPSVPYSWPWLCFLRGGMRGRGKPELDHCGKSSEHAFYKGRANKRWKNGTQRTIVNSAGAERTGWKIAGGREPASREVST